MTGQAFRLCDHNALFHITILPSLTLIFIPFSRCVGECFPTKQCCNEESGIQHCLLPIPSRSFPLLARQISLPLVQILHHLLSPGAFPLLQTLPLRHASAHPLTCLDHSSLAPPRSLPAVTTQPLAAPVALDAIAPPSQGVQSTLQTPTLTDNIPSSSPFGTSATASTTSPLQPTTVISDELLGPTRKASSLKKLPLPGSASIPALTRIVTDAPLPASTPFPVPASTSPGIDAGLSSTSPPPIGQRPPVSFGGDAPANDAGLVSSEVPDVLNLAIPTLTGGQPEATPAATIGGLNDPSIPNGEINDPAPLTSALPPGETGTATPATTAIVPSIASVHPSFISGCGVPFVSSAHTSNDYMSSASQIDLFDHHGPFEHGHGDDGDGDRFKKTSSITITTETTFYSLTEISGTP